MAAAKIAKVGAVGHAVAILVGLIVGLACAWIMSVAGEKVGARVEPYPERIREWYLGALYIAAVVWAFVAIFVGEWAAAAILRGIY